MLYSYFFPRGTVKKGPFKYFVQDPYFFPWGKIERKKKWFVNLNKGKVA